MATTTYAKPSLAGMPRDIGVRILKHIRETPAPDFEEMHKKSMEWERTAMKGWEKEHDANN